ncbi:MAG TPA: PAS domain S-box protein [Gaiellaceae bacterium]|nr:PAS domain S-box protein [Gaiellaceae bacterium]
MNRFTIALGIALFVVEASVAVAILATSDEIESPWLSISLAVSAGGAFVVSGLIALIRRPENRTGVFLAATGYVWFLGALSTSSNDWVFTVGFVLGNVVWVPFSALVLAYPTGRLETRLERAIPLAVGIMLIVPAVVAALLDPRPAQNCSTCAESAIAIADVPGAGSALDAVTTISGLALIALVITILGRRWRRASPALRRLLRPVIGAGIATLLAVALVVIAEQVSSSVADVLQVLFFAAFAAVPIAFLFGILRTKLARSSVSELVVALDRGVPLRDALAEALGDPSLDIVYRLDWRRGLGGPGWVDAQGYAVADPDSDATHSVRFVERNGERVAAVLYDPALDAEREFVDAVTAAAGMTLQNERLQAELRAEVNFMNTVTNTAPSLLVNVGTDGRIRNINVAALRATGLDDEETARGQHFWNVFIDPDEREEMKARFHAAAPDFAPDEYENLFTNATGEDLVIYWRSAPVHDERGQVVSIVAGGLDITERTRREEEVRAGEERFRAVIESAPVAIVEIGPDEEVKLWNRAAERIFGWSAEEVLGRPPVWVPDDRQEEFRALSAREAEGGTYTGFETVRKHRDGRLLDVEIAAAPIRDSAGTVAGAMAVLSDITHRKRQEDELRAGEERLQAAIRGAPVAIVEVDLGNRVRLWNPAAERIFGWAADEVIGSVVPVVPPEREGEFRSLLERVRKGEAYTGFETVRMRRDGTRIDVEISAAPIRDATGTVVSHMALFSDITDRKRHEQDLRASRARLVVAADEARQELERNLHDGAQQRLVALSVSLRLAESKLGADTAAASSILLSAREELAQALSELRELARGIHPAVLTDRGLGPAVEGLVARTPMPVEVDVCSGRLPPAVEAASYYVVAEALTNVAKYSNATGASVEVTREDGRVVIQVTDDGTGGADPARGSGLRGLADRVAALDGVLSVESTVGQGTRVRAEIPVADAVAEE